METIKLPDSEIDEMRSFYQEEYDKTRKRLEHIKAMLARLGTEDQPAIPLPSKIKQTTPAAPAASKPPVARKKRKTRRKSKWELLIMKRLRQLDKPVTYDELTDEIMTFSKLPEQKRKSTKQAVVNVIFRLRNREGKLDTFSIGTREKYIALKNWFEQPGEIKKEYAAKIERKTDAGKQKATRQKRAAKKKA